MPRPRRTIFDVIRALQATPWITQKELVKRVGVTQKQIWKWLQELSVDVRPGIDPDNQRRNVKTYAIKLSRQKKNAL